MVKTFLLSSIILCICCADISNAVTAASSPNPANGETKVLLNQVLTWTAGSGASSHLIFLGTDADAVANAEYLAGDLDASGQVDYNDLYIITENWLDVEVGDTNFTDFAPLAKEWMFKSNGQFQASAANTNFDPELEIRKTYYWRVDEVNGTEVQRGTVWSFTTADSNYSLVGKIMCGYQGWFNTPGDGTNRNWVHWPNSGTTSFTPTNCHVSMWPDTNEMTVDELVEATDFLSGSNHYYVFSSHNRNIVMRHFQWMQQYGIDGIYLQRFAKEIKDQGSSSFAHRNDILDYCKEAANTYGRAYSVMYDLSGLKLNQTSSVINDWKYLVDTKRITKDTNDNAYMYHNGKPVVAVWGIGFSDGRQYSLSECLTLVNFLKNDPVYGGCCVMVGVPSYWRTLSNDCLNDPLVHTIILAADIVSPWSVGRYGSGEVSTYANNVWAPDVQWCLANGKEYLPVIWPGYSFHNANTSKPLNEMPRYGGQFFWSQVSSTVTAAGANMLYVAMFDEVDEGTAIFKISNNPPASPAFITYRQDLPGQGVGFAPAGAELPNDEYLWLTGQAGLGLRSEISIGRTRPAR